MKKTKIKKWCASLLLSFLALCIFGMSAYATEDVPKQVMDARNGVLRILTVLEDGSVASGTGFAVGTDNNYYIVTNYHVIEGSDVILGLYDTGKYVELTVHDENPDHDLAILSTDQKIPGLNVLSLESGNIDSGMAVYALGFPGAADVLAAGFDEYDYDSLDEFVKSLNASKQSMTVTNGIISAILNSKIVGTGKTEVKLIQTNTAINRGNSGGPLLDKSGNVVGINTLGLSGIDNIESMNGSIHVEELIQLLKINRIKFSEPKSTKSNANTAKPEMVIGITAIILAAGVLFGFIIISSIRKRRKTGSPNAMTLTQFEHSNQRVHPANLCNMAQVFLNELLMLEKSTDINSILYPDNIIITPNRIYLRKNKPISRSNAKIDIYPGYSAPENFRNRAGSQASVYFVGGILYTLLTGQRPDDALTRQDSKLPLFYNPNILEEIVNAAMEPNELNRIPNLYSLYNVLAQKAPAILQQTLYTQQPAGYQPQQPYDARYHQ